MKKSVSCLCWLVFFTSSFEAVALLYPFVGAALPTITSTAVDLPHSSKTAQKVAPRTPQYHFASIELLIEQEIGRIVLPTLYKNIGIDISITPLPGKRAQYVANNGIKDGEIMRIWTYGTENPNTIRVPSPYYYLETTPFVLKSSAIKTLSKADLARYRLTKIRGVKHTNNITQGLSNVYEMSSTEDMFVLLIDKKVDVVLTNTIDGVLALERMGLSNMVSMKEPLAKLPLYHYIHKKHQSLVYLIDNEIKRAKANGELSKLISSAEKYVVELNQ